MNVLEPRLQPLGNTFLNWPCPDAEPAAKARARSFPGYIPYKLNDVVAEMPQEGHKEDPPQRRGCKMLAARPAVLEFVKDKLIVGGQQGACYDKTPCGTATTRCSDTWADAESDDDLNDDEWYAEAKEEVTKAEDVVPPSPKVIPAPCGMMPAPVADVDVKLPIGEEVTTLMLQNLPQNIVQRDLCNALDRAGFSGQYDFLYMPTMFSTGMGKGYAFVNFTTPDVAQRFLTRWSKARPFGRSQSKTLTITEAHIQGRDANIAKWDTPKMRRVRNPNHRPLVPVPNKGSRAPTLKGKA
eukprot:CAMPEP_0179119572 /NCGR_PEP_ID=MMETSP0796-20121207/56294_1 /TAXON_ID=73915 /ORGANISM="Pyrodinium bahamense, Strain pbaha01" /LENGTH=296 /DNA_ID=CAMNT_0020818077 /DNA_START=139 /DNA_END=1029 /DNA_ORIENTATION=-